MKEIPILFSDAMVRAILDGRKTQTRRVVKMKNPARFTLNDWSVGGVRVGLCPYGKPGDRLWVREAFDPAYPQDASYNDGQPLEIDYRADGKRNRLCDENGTRKWKPSIHMRREWSRILLEVTGVRVERAQDISKADAFAEGVTCRANLYSMDWSEIGLPCGAKTAYGQRSIITEQYIGNDNPVGAFATYLEKVSGEDSWDSNPWVWVVEFKRLMTA